MAGRDNSLYHVRMTSNVSAGTVVPLSLMFGIENVRQGYGNAKLKNVCAWFAVASTDTNDIKAIPITVKNSNWVDDAGLVAGDMQDVTSLTQGNLCFMRGRDKELRPNSSWIVEATVPAWTYNASTAPYLDIFVRFEIEYDTVPGFDTEFKAGSPVMKKAINASVTGNANTLIDIGSYDNLLQGVGYVMSEVSITSGNSGTAQFVVIQGFSNQRGLIRIFPVKSFGMAQQIEGSVILTKQTYNVGLISNVALSGAAVQINMEMIASAN